MTTESYQIEVTETGVSELQAQLEALGVSADQATARIATGFNRASTSQQALVSNSVLLQRAAQSGAADLGVLANALDKMTNAELNAAARSDALTASWAEQQKAAVDAAAATDALAASETKQAEAAATSAGASEKAGAAASASAAEAKSASAAFDLVKTALVGLAAYAGASELGKLADDFTNVANKVHYADTATNGLNSTLGTGGAALAATTTKVESFGGAVVASQGHVTSLSTAVSGVTNAATGVTTTLTSISGAADNVGKSFTNTSANLAAANKALADYDAGVRGTSASVSSFTDVQKQMFAGGAEGIQINDSLNASMLSREQLVNNVTRAQAAFNEAVKSGSDGLSLFTSTSKEDQAVLAQLAKTANDNQQSFDATANFYSQLELASKSLGISQQDVIKTTQGVEDVFKASGVSAEASSRALRDLAEGFNTGTIAGRQFQVIERTAPALLQDISAATGKTIDQLKESGISVQEFTQVISQLLPTLAIQAAQTVGTISGAFQTVSNKLEFFVAQSSVAKTAIAGFIGSLNLIGNNIGPIIIALGSLGAAFVVSKVYGYAAALVELANSEKVAAAGAAALEFAISPVGIAITAIVASVAYLVDGYANYLVQTGQASDKTQAFGIILQKLYDAVSPIINVVKNLASEFVSLIGQLVGTDQHATDLTGTLDTIKDILTTIGPYVQKFGEVFINAFSLIITSAKNLGVVLGNIITQLSRISSGTADFSIGSLTNGVQAAPQVGDNQPASRDGNVFQARNGIDINSVANSIYSAEGYVIPGVDKPDTVPVNLMVSRGERIMVQTQAQQAVHDGALAAFGDALNVTHLRSGGVVYAADGVTLGTVRDPIIKGQQITGPANSNLPTTLGNASPGGPGSSLATLTGSGGAGTSTPLAQPASGSAGGFQGFTGQFAGFAGFDTGAGFITSNANSVQGYQGFTVSSPSASITTTSAASTTDSTSAASTPTTTSSTTTTTTQDSEPAAIGDLDQSDVDYFAALAKRNPGGAADIAYNLHTLVPYPGVARSVDYGSASNLAGLHMAFTDGTSTEIKDCAGNTITANQGTIAGIGLPIAGGVPLIANGGEPIPVIYDSSLWFNENASAYYKDLTGFQLTGTQGLDGPTSGSNGYLRDGGTIYARDGADFTIPGVDAPDSRVVNMAVSPGERVQVHTPQQDAANNNGRGGGNTIINNHITTPSPAAFRASERQIGQRTARAAKRAGL